MSIIDINDLQSNSMVTADICIVGSGAAGITVASEFDGLSPTVSLIESGSYEPDEATQSLYDMDIAGYPVRENFMSRARYFGGTCNFWAGRSMILHEIDITPRAWVPHSGWPITYAELQRYYGKASQILRLPSFETFRNVTLPRKMSQVETLLLAHNDVQPNISLWAKSPLRFGAVYKRQLKKSQNITLYLNANVTDIQLHHDGQAVTALSTSTLEGKKIVMQAKHFVLACGGLENARLLLVSRQVQKNGIGNQFDVVGRYYMDHPRAVFGKVKLAGTYQLPLLLGMPLSDGMAQVGIQFSERMQQQEGLLNNYLTLERHWSDQTAKVYQSFVRSMKIVLRKGYAGKRFTVSRANLAKIPELIYLLSPREIMPHFLYKHYKTIRDSLGGHLAELIIVNYCDQAPNPQSRVSLGSQRDRLHMPRLILDWKIGEAETRSLQRLLQVVDQHLRHHRIGFIDNTRPESGELSFTDASHHLGTTRMTDNPRQGVVDNHCRVFGVNNLFIAGSSVFPTAGHANPTLTIVALAIRLADHLKAVTKSLPH